MSLAPHVLVDGSLAATAVGTVVPLAPATVHHLRRALRRTDGSALTLTDGLGAQAPAVLEAEGARLTGVPVSEASIRPRLTLAQALAKGRRADDAVRMACELGVDRIVPVVADRTQGRPDGRAAAALVERWQAVAVAALEQSRGTRLAEVAPCCTTAELAAATSARLGDAARGSVGLVTVPGAPALPDAVAQLQADGAAAGGGPDELLVAVGPEGGWSTEEVDLLVASGWAPVGLGATVLRTEHAGTVAVAVLAALSGRWRTPHSDLDT